MRALDQCPDPGLILSFDFDGTLHDPAQDPPVPREFFNTILDLRKSRRAVWGINTGRSISQVFEGFLESTFPFLPDWVVAREQEIYFPNKFGRFVSHRDWNDRCEKDIRKLFARSKVTLREVRKLVEEHTGAQYIELKGEPAGFISRTEEEMEWIVGRIAPLIAAVPDLGWQRNSIYLRFGHRNYQKGSALTEVARLYGLDASKTFACGDSHNDIEMLWPEHSGYAACPSNAVPAICELVEARSGLVTAAAHGQGVVEALLKTFP